MTRQEQIEQAARIYGHDNPNCHWNADAEYEVDYDIPAEDFKAGVAWADANPDHYEEGYNQGWKDAIEKCCLYMENCKGYVVSGNKCNYDNFIKFMEE